MTTIGKQLAEVKALLPEGVTLVAVSKTHAPERIMEAYEAGQRIFGENRVQELVPKYEALPKDIEWHLIGHLQTNKVKYLAPFVSLIHSVDSEKLLSEINKQAEKCGRVIDVLLQVFVANEETKFGFLPEEISNLYASQGITGYKHVRIRGLMAMATNTDNREQIKEEFLRVATLFNSLKTQATPAFNVLSMGMSSDWQIAVQQGSNMVRIGSTIFGNR
jgi:pyridoxal phosphate enzyme (YggS family)